MEKPLVKLKTVIGSSDYSRKQMESGDTGWSIGDPNYILNAVKLYEEEGFKVEFKTNIFRRIFAFGIYKIVATKTIYKSYTEMEKAKS